MRVLGCLSFALVFGVLCFALGVSHSPDGFASRWAPALSMPSEGITVVSRRLILPHDKITLTTADESSKARRETANHYHGIEGM